MDAPDVNTTTPENCSLLRQDSSNKDVSSSSSAGSELHPVVTDNCVSNSGNRGGELVERVHGIRLENKEAASSSVGLNLMTMRTATSSKVGMFEEEEEGELDYEEDEGEPVGVDEGNNAVKNDTGDQDKQKEEGELEEGELDSEGEEGEIFSDEDVKANAEKKEDKGDVKIKETDGLEEGEVIEDGDMSGVVPTKRKICRYFTYGSCTWGMACRFLHPGLNDKGAYQMLPIPGQYPSPFPKAPPVLPLIPPESVLPTQVTPPFPDQDAGQMDDETGDGLVPVPEVVAPPKKESAWERGLKLAKEIKKAAQKRKEEDADFEQKRMILGVTADEEEDEHDKENVTRRRDARSRLEKDSTYRDEDDVTSRTRRPEDIVSRWRDKRDSSPHHYRDRERRKKKTNRSPSSSPERERRSRRRGGEKDKSRDKNKEKDREKDRTKKPPKEDDKKREEKVKKHKEKEKEKEKGSESGKEKTAVVEEKKDEEMKEVKEKEEETPSVSVKEENETKNKVEKIKEEATTKEKKTEEASTRVKPEVTKEPSKESYGEGGEDDKDKTKAKTMGISSSRLPNDEWIDPWQRATSPKRHSTSSHSSRSRSSSSSSESSRSSRSRSRSGSESRSSSRSGSRSQSRSVSRTPSRSPSRSRSGSRSKSRSRSGSRSSASDRSSSTSSTSHTKEAPTAPEEVVTQEGVTKQASGSEYESEESRSAASAASPAPASAPAPAPVKKSPVKPKSPPDPAPPRTQPAEPSPSNQKIKEKRNRYEHGRADRTDKLRVDQPRPAPRPWDRKAGGVRGEGQPYSRGRPYHYPRGRSPDRRRRSRSPRDRDEERRRRDEARTRRRSSSADSMEHALARPSSPRPTRERGEGRGGSSGSSSDSESGSSGESETESRSEGEGNAVKTRRAAPGAEPVKQAPNIPLTSGNIRYAGHKDIKLTLNIKSAGSKAEENIPSARPPSQHSPPARSEASSSSDKPSVAQKRPRPPSPVPIAQNPPKEVVSSTETPPSAVKPVRRSADSQVQAEAMTSALKAANAASTSSRREELLRELKAVEDAIARKRARIE